MPSRCPRCGLNVSPRASWLAVRYCPRCLARNQTIVELSQASLAADVRDPGPRASRGIEARGAASRQANVILELRARSPASQRQSVSERRRTAIVPGGRAPRPTWR